MKVLVFSNTQWNTYNIFSNIYSSIFEGIENIEFVNIYNTPDSPKSMVRTKYFQITEKNLPKNLFNYNIKTGAEFSTPLTNKIQEAFDIPSSVSLVGFVPSNKISKCHIE